MLSWHEEPLGVKPVDAARSEQLARPIRSTPVPYDAWANPGPDAMHVWVPMGIAREVSGRACGPSTSSGRTVN